MSEIQAGDQTVLLHLEDFEDIEELSDSDSGILLKAIVGYMRDKSISGRLSGDVKIMFRYIRRHIDRDKANYLETCRKRAEAGRKGGFAKAGNAKQSMAKAGNAKQSMANLPDYESDNDYDYESVSVSDSESDTVATAAEAAASLPEGERENRIKFLRTMMLLGNGGHIAEEDLARYRAELAQLTGG